MSAQLLTLAIPLVLGVICLATIVRLLIGRPHPVRILSSALGVGSLLIIASFTTSLVGATGIIWWLLLVAAVIAVILASVRTARAGGSTSDPAAVAGPGTSSGSATASRTRAVRRPGWFAWVDLVLEILVFCALGALAVWAG